jgi:hypothetical protein
MRSSPRCGILAPETGNQILTDDWRQHTSEARLTKPEHRMLGSLKGFGWVHIKNIVLPP